MLGILILVVEFLWIGEVIRRLPRDVRDFMRPWDKRDRVVTAFIWTLTLLFMGHLGWLAWVWFAPAVRAIMLSR